MSLLENKKYNRFNFHKYTFCDFQEVAENALNELQLAYTSKSGSSYYFTKEGVYRVANHWGRVANCRWRLISSNDKPNQNLRIGYAEWINFFPNNETEKLFYIEVDYELKTVKFHHKFNSNFNGKKILRTANETAKAIKNCKIILNTTNWAKHFEKKDLEFLRKELIEQIIYSNKSFLEIRKNIMNQG